jgi:uncharacterized membrane protein (DUF2068 family)
LGIIVLTVAQFTIGIIHVFFGFLLVFAESSAAFIISAQPSLIYSIYTLAFGLLILIFAYGIWLGRRWGWTGTVGVFIFVIVVDAFTILNLPSIPGIPKLAASAEIVYSLGVLLYLSQKHVRAQFKSSK